ncbi:ABC transporter permease [Rhizobium leguminosarum bv. viciae]|uniref:ABC transporter permease n=1 Tax=Rhizobium leguminosarum TaxID=384 RepID=UPI0014414D9D|nr:ABC transporter permease [Rhizobium leguminosarum]NKJ94728.1 ABC transporter permease [Rhizobium leguminosarum bv. viciae]NKK87458.1 ABC transporter permease [Rhizobium leguminosarum bv. viciae]
MSIVNSPSLNRSRPTSLPVPAVILGLAAIIYFGAAIMTGQLSQLTFEGLAGLLQRTVALGIVALGQTFTILVGSIDLSVAALISLVAVLAGYIMQGDPGMIAPAIFLCMVVSFVVGAINGLLVAYWGINPLIATLGSGLIIQGGLSAGFTHMGGSVAPRFQAFAYSGLLGVPYSVLMFAALTLGGWFVLTKTRFGANLYAVGGNPDGARLVGLRTERFVLSAHIFASLAAGIAGLYLAARLQSGTPWIGRDGIYDLESIATVVIGGTILAGGKGGVVGTAAGVLLFASLDASFNMFGVDAFLKQVLRGGIVITAVGVYAVRNRGHVA